MQRYKYIIKWLSFLVISICASWTTAEVFTSAADMELLLKDYMMIIDSIDNYIAKEEERLGDLKRQLILHRDEINRATVDSSYYLGNPINCYILIKRLTRDLPNIQDNMNNSTGNNDWLIKKIMNIQNSPKYPTVDDLIGAGKGLSRLARVYNLNVADLAQGNLNNVSFGSPMSAEDCYEVGQTMYNSVDCKYTLPWMKQALAEMKSDEGPHGMTEVDVMDYLSYCSYKNGELEDALDWSRRMLEIEPDHERARTNSMYYEREIRRLKWRNSSSTFSSNAPIETLLEDNEYEEMVRNYSTLCRGELELPPSVTRELKCWYATQYHPFLRIAPFKVEQQYTKPDIFLFHEVMTDGEIEVIKRLAQPKLRRAVVRGENEASEVVDYRISQSGWLDDAEHPVVSRISRRISDMTGLRVTSDSAENLQVGNYGIGGHYEPHFDFVRNTDNPFGIELGNRIATVLFYMSNVEQGGATVFTELGLSVFPVKNSAVVWWNLHPSGEGDLGTKHAACPVLQGSKWVSNKWIHQAGQELRWPCELQYQRQDHLYRKEPAIPKANISMQLTSR